MKKINVLQLITGLGMGGAEKVVLELSRNISKNDFNTFVVSMSKRDELLDEFEENKINTTILNRANSLIDMFMIVKTINKFLKENDIQIIHAHMAHSIIIASILKLLNPSIKIVFTSHTLNIGSKFRELIVFLLKPLRDIDIIFSKDLLKYFYKSKYSIIPNGVKIDRYNLSLEKNDKFTFIAIGRLENVKNHKFLIQLANNLKNSYDFEIQIIGDGYLKEELNNLIEIHNLQSQVKLLGLRNDIPELLNKSHCLLMPSLWEGLPMVILEAGASSLPIISTPVGSIPSIINENNGYLASFEDFEKSIIKVLEDYSLAKEKGLNLFKDVSNEYSISSIVNEHENLYKSLLNDIKN